MLQSETPSLPKTKTTKSEPKQSLIMADLKPGLACCPIFSINLIIVFKVTDWKTVVPQNAGNNEAQ